MPAQTEQQLENDLIANLVALKYDRVRLPNEAALLANLKRQLEKHNKTTFSKKEFGRILSHLNKGNVFKRAQILRDRYTLQRDDHTSTYIQFLDQVNWCQNEYQVANQITIEGRRKNRYDVTILINGLPLCQIELKRRGIEMAKAFDQINRYHRDSFKAAYGLFQYVQIFVISNGTNSLYYTNNSRQDFKQTSFWTNKDNRRIAKLEDFTKSFLERCHLSKIICKYIVLHQTNKVLMALRPYQYYAAETIQQLVKKNNQQNGYIWHTTGSGKTLTSFKASQLVAENPDVHKVLFVVDRNDLDYQTSQEFNYFSDGSVDGTSNTKGLIDQLLGQYVDPGTKEPKVTKLIVTTIQKLSRAITRGSKKINSLRDKKILFIFDECHRSQFGETHANINRFFRNNQMVGFTGTPILKDNAVKNQFGTWTTDTLFQQCLHKYLLPNAIKDKKVLQFSIDYVGKWTKKDGTEPDLKVKNIDKKELYESDKRIADISQYILNIHQGKTKKQHFTAMFCVPNVAMAIKYYEEFNRRKKAGEHDLKIATIFTYGANEPDPNANGDLPGEIETMEEGQPIDVSKRDKLESFIHDYNTMYNVNHSIGDSKNFEIYRKDISKRIKERERADAKDSDRLDILIVAYMFLTGFDARRLNTLYVDKNLKMHGLIQAFSRTNRILGPLKSHGDIVCFRPLKAAVDEAIALFSNQEAVGGILMEAYDVYLQKFKEALAKLKTIAPTPDDVHDLLGETAIKEFVLAFREALRNENILKGFSEHEADNLGIDIDTFKDYQSQYYDLKDKRNTKGEKISVIDEIDFEVELLHREIISIDYILRLLGELHNAQKDKGEQAKKREEIKRILNTEIELRSKKELIDQFIDENLPHISNPEDIPASFETYWQAQKELAIKAFAEEEQLKLDGLHNVLNRYRYDGKLPLSDNINPILIQKLRLRQRRIKVAKVIEGILDLMEKFEGFED